MNASTELIPQRRILHCDMDCFYAQVHMRDDRNLRGKPVVIGGSPKSRGVVAAASYEARKFGVRSAIPSAQAARLCPEAIFLAPDFPRYQTESQQIFEIFRRFTELVQPASLDEAYLDVSETFAPWGSATALAQEIRRLVKVERGLTVSVGVGPNRLIAKIASDFHKPDGLTVVRPDKVQAFLDPLPVRKLHGVGPATELVLQGLGLKTIADLRRLTRAELETRFGKHGTWLFESSHGIDERPVETHWERKSLGHERTYQRDLVNLELMVVELEKLADQVFEGLERRGLHARTLTVKVRYPDFTTLTRARSLTAPFESARAIGAIAHELLRQTAAAERGVRLLGLTASGFETKDSPGASGPDLPSQLELFVADADGTIRPCQAA
jgi:DNA polymerase IV